MDERSLREELARICKLLYDRQLTFSSGGNMSARVDEESIIITPSGKNKGMLKPEDMVKVSLDGDVLEGGKPSIEVGMHLIYYREREDVNAILHCHSPYCTSLAIMGERLRSNLTPEGAVLLGEVPIAPYGTPGTHRLVDSVKEHVDSDCVIMERHGALAVGSDIMAAFNRYEELEFHARLQFIIGDRAREFDPEEIERIKKG